MVIGIFSPVNIMILLIINFLIFLTAGLYEKLHKDNYKLKITREIAESTNDAVLITDASTTITYINKAYEQATGYSQGEVLGHKPNEFKSGQHNREFYIKMWDSIKQTGTWEGLIWDKRKNGVFYPKQLRIMSVQEKKGDPVSHYIGIFKVLSENDKKMNSIESDSDDIPGLKLANEEMLIQLLDSNIRDKSFRFMVICITIENFNELMSLHDQFDPGVISRIFIDLLKPLIHQEDFVAQTSRNMFSVIINLNHIQIPHDDFISNFYREMSQIVKKDNCELFFKTRMGVSFWPNDASDIKKLLLHSIIALEWTINRQSREYAFYAPEMIETISTENKIERLLKKALALKELYLVYQPQVDAETGLAIGAEALLRWNNQEMGNIPPGQFIPIAEKSTIIIEIGYWILERVCRDIKSLIQKQAINPGQFKIAVNVSPLQLEDPSFSKKALSIIDSFSLDHRLIEFEITESLLMSNQEANNLIIETFRSQNFSIALDDFGTGYSSLSYLQKLPIDKIKIDRSFIKDYPETDDGKMAKILINMAKMLDMRVLTEGVENPEQLQFLKENGCNIIQGFYFSKPLKFDEFQGFLTPELSMSEHRS
jgi:PAS domain S-box-containing protein